MLGFVHLIVGWSVGWLKVHFFSVVVAPVWPYVLYQALLRDGMAPRALYIDCHDDFYDVRHTCFFFFSWYKYNQQIILHTNLV